MTSAEPIDPMIFYRAFRGWLSQSPVPPTQLEWYAKPFWVKIRYNKEEDEIYRIYMTCSNAWFVQAGGNTLDEAFQNVEQALLQGNYERATP